MDPITLAILGSSLVSAGASVGGAIYSNKKNSENVDKQNKFNLDMWKMANQYNTPVAQVNRLREAGINPALALGNISPGTAQGVTSATHQPTINPLQDLPNIVGNGISQTMQYDLMKKQKEQIESNIRLNNANASGTEIANKYVDAREQADISQKNAGSAKLQADADLSRQVWENNRISLPLQNKLTEKQIEVCSKTAQKIDVEIDTAKYELEFLKPVERKLLNAQISNIYAGISLIREKVLSEQVGREFVQANIQKVFKEIDALSLQNNWSKDTYNDRVNQVTAALKGTLANTDYLYKSIDNIDHKEVMDWCNFSLSAFNSVVNAVK